MAETDTIKHMFTNIPLDSIRLVKMLFPWDDVQRRAKFVANHHVSFRSWSSTGIAEVATRVVSAVVSELSGVKREITNFISRTLDPSAQTALENQVSIFHWVINRFACFEIRWLLRVRAVAVGWFGQPRASPLV